MKSRDRMILAMFLLVLLGLAHAMKSPLAPTTGCSSCGRGYTVNVTGGFAGNFR